MAKTAEPTDLLGVGLYTPAEASRLLRIPSSTLRRWVEGYSFPLARATKTFMPALVAPALPRLGRTFTLTFLDLVQLRVVKALRDEDVALQQIRVAGEQAMSLFRVSHPFASVHFKTDGRRVYAEVPGADNELLIELRHPDRVASRPVLKESLREISHARSYGALADRWYAAGPEGGVVIDPRIAFGKPVVDRANVPTEVIRDQARAARNLEAVASWYGLTTKQVRNALDYEQQLAA
jgi:uncharacterized protein (DUF433 family)